jgi:hypothetical protein
LLCACARTPGGGVGVPFAGHVRKTLPGREGSSGSDEGHPHSEQVLSIPSPFPPPASAATEQAYPHTRIPWSEAVTLRRMGCGKRPGYHGSSTQVPSINSWQLFGGGDAHCG